SGSSPRSRRQRPVHPASYGAADATGAPFLQPAAPPARAILYMRYKSYVSGLQIVTVHPGTCRELLAYFLFLSIVYTIKRREKCLNTSHNPKTVVHSL